MSVKFKWIAFNVAILLSLHSFSQTRQKITSSSIDQSLRKVLNDISVKKGFNFIYSDNLVNNITIDYKFNDEPVEDFLGKLSRRYDISYKIYNGSNIVLFKEIKPKNELYKAVILDKNVSTDDSLNLIVKPTMITNKKLEYPQQAVIDKVEGKTIVKFLIDGAGDVSKALIKSSSGNEVLDSASIRYARELKFIPAETNGTTQSIWMTMVFRYTISKN